MLSSQQAAYTFDEPLFPIWGVSRQAKNCKNLTNFQGRGEIWQRKLHANLRSSCSVKNPWAVCKWTAKNHMPEKTALWEKNNLHIPRNPSTIASLLEVVNEWKWAKDKGLITTAMFLDLRKAFDVIDHSLLLQKLKANGISGAEHAWFRSFLANRNQFVQCNGGNSNERTVTHGVHQGSIQWNLDLTKSLGTDQICSLNRGFVKSKTSI